MRCEEFSLWKVNMSEHTLLYLSQGDLSYKNNDHTLLYLNQGGVSYKNNEKIIYAENLIIGQILADVPLADIPFDLSTYELKPDEVKMLVTKYNKSTGQFLSIVETIGQLIFRGKEGEVFLNNGYRAENSKLLYIARKLQIPNSFRGCMFSKHKRLFEKRKLSPDVSRIYYYNY